MVKNIASALCEHQRWSKFESDEFKSFELLKHQKVRIEDLLQIFVDDMDLVKEFLEHVIKELDAKYPKELEKLRSTNLHHRLLEYMLHEYDRHKKNPNNSHYAGTTMQAEPTKIKKEIISFITMHDQKIDKHYVLFLFQIYDFSDGVKECCEKIGLK